MPPAGQGNGMICRSCGDKGLIRVEWSDAPDDYAICLCLTGLALRNDTNAGKHTGYALWQAVVAQRQIDPAHVFLIEEILTPAELAARGFHLPAARAGASREAALLAAGRPRKAKL